MSKKGENIYKRKDSRWEGRYKCGINENGKTKYKSVYSNSYKSCKHFIYSKELLSMNKSIHHSEVICNCLSARNILEKLNAYALEYIISIIISIFFTGYRGKTVDFERHSNRHRTSISRFLKSEN